MYGQEALNIIYDRYPAIYVDHHIWKCTAGLVRAAILKSEKVLVVFSQNLKYPEKIFQHLMLRESRRVFASDDLEFLKGELNQDNAIAGEAESSNSLAHGKL